MGSTEITIDEIIGRVSLIYPAISNMEIEVLQWAYDAEKLNGGNDNWPNIGWEFQAPSGYDATYVVLPSDVVQVQEVYLNDVRLVELTGRWDREMDSNDFYRKGNVLHFKSIPTNVKALVTRLPMNSDGRLLINEDNALAVENYILRNIFRREMGLAQNIQDINVARAKFREYDKMYLDSRRIARGERNSPSNVQRETANYFFHNTFSSYKFKKVWR